MVKILQTAVEDQDSDIRKLKKGKGNILEKFNQADQDIENRVESLERKIRTEHNFDLKREFDQKFEFLLSKIENSKIGDKITLSDFGKDQNNFDPKILESKLNSWTEKIEDTINSIEDRVLEKPTISQVQWEIQKQLLEKDAIIQKIH